LQNIAKSRYQEKEAYFKDVDPALAKGLRLKDEDMASASDLMLLCHSKEINGQRVVHDDIWIDERLRYDDPGMSPT